MAMGLSMCLIWCLWRINSESRIKRITQIAQIKSGQSVNSKQFENPWQIRMKPRMQLINGKLKHGEITEKIIGTAFGILLDWNNEIYDWVDSRGTAVVEK